MYGQLSYDMEVSLSCSSPACRIQPVKRHQRHAPFFETKLLFFQFTLCFIFSTRLAHRDIWQDKISMSILSCLPYPVKNCQAIPDGRSPTRFAPPNTNDFRIRLSTAVSALGASKQWPLEAWFTGGSMGHPKKKWRISWNKSGCNAGGMFLVWTDLVQIKTWRCWSISELSIVIFHLGFHSVISYELKIGIWEQEQSIRHSAWNMF
jgi:hypothetical protein